MITVSPMPLDAAIRLADSRDLLPTHLGSAELRERFSPEIRRKAVFSAHVTSADYLQAVKDVAAKIRAGEINQAQAREQLLAVLDDLNYNPALGWGDGSDPDRQVPPAERETMQDHGSRQRLDLVLDVQVRQALNRGFVEQWQSPEMRQAFPAWELVRIAWREVPRGMKRSKGALEPDPENGWPARWARVGGKFYAGRMIALIDDGIWARLGDSEIFRDALDTAHPPFAFGSGYGIRGVRRLEAIRLGVPLPGVTPKAPDTPPAPEPEIRKGRFDPEILAKLRRKLDERLKDWDSGKTAERERRRAETGKEPA